MEIGLTMAVSLNSGVHLQGIWDSFRGKLRKFPILAGPAMMAHGGKLRTFALSVL